ncbi:MAG TPA: apolipoprotein N-acyltransferase, partial [Polyangiaceae bacterium]|nr:apolipoprotein N-acyltransferase [Polyangiaceae bacterium]
LDKRAIATDPIEVYRAESLNLLGESPVDLLIWPETAISFPVDEGSISRVLRRDFFGDARDGESRARVDVPLLTGVVLERPPPPSHANVHAVDRDGIWREPPRTRFNSAVLATPDGRILGVYDKHDLLPFGEYVPREETFPSLRRWVPSAGRFSAGTSSAPLSLNDVRLLLMICYEDVVADHVRDAVVDGEPDLLVNLTSDAWFANSRVPALHLALAKLRSIEHRRFLVHATTTGDTAVIDATGRTVARLPQHRLASAAADVRLLRTHTLYEACGRLPAALTLAGAIALALGRRPRKRIDLTSRRPEASSLRCPGHGRRRSSSRRRYP